MRSDPKPTPTACPVRPATLRRIGRLVARESPGLIFAGLLIDRGPGTAATIPLRLPKPARRP